MNDHKPTSASVESSHHIFLTWISIFSLIIGVIGSFYAVAGALFDNDVSILANLISGLLHFAIGLDVGQKCRQFRPAPLIAGSVGIFIFPLPLMIIPLLVIWIAGGLGQRLGISLKSSQKSATAKARQ